MTQLMIKRSESTLLRLACAGILSGAGLELYNIAWGTGTWWGEFSLKWGVTFFLFVTLSALSWGSGCRALIAPASVPGHTPYCSSRTSEAGIFRLPGISVVKRCCYSAFDLGNIGLFDFK